MVPPHIFCAICKLFCCTCSVWFNVSLCVASMSCFFIIPLSFIPPFLSCVQGQLSFELYKLSIPGRAITQFRRGYLTHIREGDDVSCSGTTRFSVFLFLWQKSKIFSSKNYEKRRKPIVCNLCYNLTYIYCDFTYFLCHLQILFHWQYIEIKLLLFWCPVSLLICSSFLGFARTRNVMLQCVILHHHPSRFFVQ